MTTHNPNNERVKRSYFLYLKEARRQSEASVDAAAKALARFEADTKYRDFRAFHFEQAVAFKRRLSNQDSRSTGGKLSEATLTATLAQLRRFFQWLSGKPGYKSRLQYSDADYFNLSEKEARVATARRARPAPTLEQVRHVISLMPAGSEIERRDRALLAFALLTGARDDAIASMKLKHVDLAAGSVFQDARDVRTKFSKTFTTFFFPVGEDVRQIVEDWVQYLRQDKLGGNDAPLFPATLVELGKTRQFEATGLAQRHWQTTSPIRAIFTKAFKAAGLPYFNPHSVRSTLAQLGQTLCRYPEQFKAWSQNLGHENVLTTFLSYGNVALSRQGQLMQDLARAPTNPYSQPEEAARVLLEAMKSAGQLPATNGSSPEAAIGSVEPAVEIPSEW